MYRIHEHSDSAGKTRSIVPLAVFSLLLFTSTTVAAQGAECDCSCDAYQKMMEVMQEARTAAQAGDYAGMPPEAAMMGQCAGSCAMQWARCANPNADLSGASQSSADSTTGGAMASREMIRQAQQRQEPEADDGLPKDQLTPKYLEGRWCSVYGGQETTEWLFNSEGGYQIGVPAGAGYAMQPGVRSLEHFRGRFERLVEFEQDSFTTVHRHGRENVFTRGACG